MGETYLIQLPTGHYVAIVATATFGDLLISLLLLMVLLILVTMLVLLAVSK